ncbi:MAG: 2-C-methyl-D-erythritol 2,4-cyclodiphosphate synthase [Oscillospiraceae bacterium]|jgi:2-C-methyl-D-erythritol 4-phosphate cytidylyltransferase/2-C-methyl-D-erythritol 2,4-cyclodiphosphate synthase|nr:2-C-methyl-D-erythritol 2,4-cyclodiphosphate synthase [Oscillospiraceae bacterium]
MQRPFVSAIIVGAGSSTRMGDRNKITAKLLNGEMVIEFCIKPFINSELVDEVIIVTSEGLVADFKAWFESGKVKVVKGGKMRSDSAFLGVMATNEKADFVCIHDAARPFASEKLLQRCLESGMKYGAAIPVLASENTLKLAKNEAVVATLKRDEIFQVQTPQVFKKLDYVEAMTFAREYNKSFADDSQLFEMRGLPVHTVAGEKTNIKITVKDDLALANAVLSQMGSCEGEHTMKIGHGYDVHRLVKGKKLVIGGKAIDHELGLEGHSDADVLVHAIIDALLGAAGLEDIGCFFPPEDDSFKDVSSLKLLAKIKEILENQSFHVVNIDSTIIAQYPKLAGYVGEMRRNVAEALGCKADQVNIKATTEEGLGFTGTSQGIAVHAVCLICK